MADKTINQLTQATGLTDSSLFVIEQNSTAKQANWGMMKNYISPGVASQYSTSATYNVGDYVIYNGSLYRCNTAITTGEAWTAAHWTAAVLGNDVSELKSALGDNTAIHLNVDSDGTKKNIVFTHIGDNVVTIVGQGNGTGAALQNLIQNENLPSGFTDNGKICIYFQDITRTVSGTINFDVYVKVSGSSSWTSLISNKSGIVVEDLPSGCTGILVRTHIASDVTYNEKIKVFVNNGYFPNLQLPEDHFLASQYRNSTAAYLEETDFNNVTNNGFYCWSGKAYTHNPYPLSTDVGFLFVMRWNNIVWQLVTGFGPARNKAFIREKSNNDWNSWKEFGGNEESTLFMQPTGDNTDVSSNIESALSDAGICRLSAGNFYVSGIDMPDGTALIGSGPDTRVILLGANTDEGYAIKIGSNCLVQNMTIVGNTTDIEYSGVSSNIVERHGILFSGHFSTDQTDYKTRSLVNSCWIKNFTGGGITCNDTGYGTAACLGVTDCYIWYCNAGLYVPFFSEFHRFTSVHCHNCYYGAVNNGGNCVFVNCGFSANKVGMLMDNTSGTLRNDSHGTVVGCVFDHANGNNGTGIKIIGMSNGEIFSDCQLFYSDIEIKNSKGLQFNNFNVGGTGVNIKVEKGSDGGLVLFNNWVFKTDSYTFQIDSGYSECKLNNCWTWDGVAVTGA